MFCTNCGVKQVVDFSYCPECVTPFVKKKAHLTTKLESKTAITYTDSAKWKVLAIVAVVLITGVAIFVIINRSPVVGRWVNGHGATLEFFRDGTVVYRGGTIGSWTSDGGGRVALDFSGTRANLSISGMWRYSNLRGRGYIMWQDGRGSLTNIMFDRPDSVFDRQ